MHCHYQIVFCSSLTGIHLSLGDRLPSGTVAVELGLLKKTAELILLSSQLLVLATDENESSRVLSTAGNVGWITDYFDSDKSKALELVEFELEVVVEVKVVIVLEQVQHSFVSCVDLVSIGKAHISKVLLEVA